ncbi:MAG: SPOR domain-containing protein [Proteobacteria bacterium]|nr:SPOR domain-containing protein [Pseudomonadota bacterium]MCL2307581.1 SPOR domain-containing protein [Pseudomonadota bacterium]
MKDDKLEEMALIDEMKRRNRRRLVGAVVLAVCAIIFVPMLLEKEPAPLGDNVEIVIPPVTGTKLPDTPPPMVEPVEPPDVAPREIPAEPPKQAPKEVAKETPKEPPKEAPKKLPPTVAFAKGTFSVQLAAFTDDKGANAMVNRVKQAGYPAYSEPTDTARGMAWRVRVGPYKTREDAALVRDRLKKNSYDGMIVPAR